MDNEHVKKDFFISYTNKDTYWAEWISWQIEAAGYTCAIQSWDISGGENFVRKIHDYLINCNRTIAVLSSSYLKSAYCADEWQAAFLQRSLIPVRIENVSPPGLLANLTYADLYGVSEDVARERLLKALNRVRVKPAKEPLFPERNLPELYSRKPDFPSGSLIKTDYLSPPYVGTFGSTA